MGNYLGRQPKKVVREFDFSTEQERQEWLDTKFKEYQNVSDFKLYEYDEAPRKQIHKSKHPSWSNEARREDFLYMLNIKDKRKKQK